MSIPLVFFQEPHSTIQCARLVLNLYQKQSTMHSWLCRSSLKSVEIWTDGCFCVCCKICITALNMWEEARKCCTPFTYVSSVGLEKMIKALESDQASFLLHHTRLYSHVQSKPRTFYVCSPRVPPEIIQLLLMCQTCPQPFIKTYDPRHHGCVCRASKLSDRRFYCCPSSLSNTPWTWKPGI
jgi:hypothetical protein